MRVVGGRWAGRDLLSPSGRVRPTAEPVRAAIAELVADDLQGARTLDLFAGTGAVGIEFLSRGARSCDFVEDDPSALHALKANVAGLRLPAGRTRIFRKDAIPFVEGLGAGRSGRERRGEDLYDLAFADPPWGSRKLDRVLRAWRMRPFSRLLLLEHAADHPPQDLHAPPALPTPGDLPAPGDRPADPQSAPQAGPRTASQADRRRDHRNGPRPEDLSEVMETEVIQRQVGDAMLTLLRRSGSPGTRP
jgi:16S rRNA (guanine966-N2)-methyltransferase